MSHSWDEIVGSHLLSEVLSYLVAKTELKGDSMTVNAIAQHRIGV